MSNRAIPGMLYKHFKGDTYKVHFIAEHSETGEELVVYEAMYGLHKMYCRPRAMFEELVQDPNMPGRMIPRFRMLEVLPYAGY